MLGELYRTLHKHRGGHGLQSVGSDLGMGNGVVDDSVSVIEEGNGGVLKQFQPYHKCAST